MRADAASGAFHGVHSFGTFSHNGDGPADSIRETQDFSGKEVAMKTRIKHLVVAQIALTACTLLVACPSPPNQWIDCSLEDIDFGLLCIPPEYQELSHAACQHQCEEWQESLPPGDPSLGYDCSEVSDENVTGEIHSECEIDVDWEEVILEDPDSGYTHSYGCSAPWPANDYYCPWDVDMDGLVENNEGTYLTQTQFQGCGTDSTAGHQSCIDNCGEILEDINLYLTLNGVTDCSFPVTLCGSLDFAFEYHGQVCTAQMVMDRTGDRAEMITWSTEDGGSATRPLSCSLSGDCCEEFGLGACSNIRLGNRNAPVAGNTNALVGTVTYRSSERAKPREIAVSASVRTSSRTCNNSANTCPMYLDDLQIAFPQDVDGVVIDGARYDLSDMAVRLDAPTLGVLDTRTRAVKLLGDRLPLRVTATASVSATNTSIRVDELPALPAEIDARMSPNGDIVELTVVHAPQGSEATLTIELTQATTPRGGAR